MRGGNNMRVEKHPILGDLPNREMITFYYNGKPLQAIKGEMVASALMAAGVKVMRKTAKHHKPRGIFCAIGRCTDCVMVVNGVPGIRTCVTPVEEGMKVETQYGTGKWSTNE